VARRSVWSNRFKNRITSEKQGHGACRIDANIPILLSTAFLMESLFPVHEWQNLMKSAQAVIEINVWSVDDGDADDAILIQEIRTKVLPRRGISARADEIGETHVLDCA